jgi:signal transduction histidine kinase
MEDQRQIQSLLTRLVLAEESERRRIARGLHDDVGQTLLAAKLSLDELLESGVPGSADSSMQEIQRQVNHAIKTTRTLSFELASAALYEVGVGAALQSECELAQRRSGIQFQPPEQLTGHPIPMEVEVILFRAGRELIRNIVKHSNARLAKLSLSVRGSGLRLTVTDDGRGFDSSKNVLRSDPTSGFGLFSIDQQLDSIDGRLKITSSLESGTCAVVTVALDAMQERT